MERTRFAHKKRALLLITLAVTLIAFSVTPTLSATDLPYHVRLTWQHSPSSTMMVTWDTDPGLGGYVPTVRYGTVKGGYSKTAHGAMHSYPGATVDVSDVELTGLSPDTRYYYICGSTGYGWSPERSFSTPPGSGKELVFCAMGDSREALGPTGDNSNFQIWGQITGAIAAENPRFCLFTGDAVTTLDSESTWNSWYQGLATLSGKSPVMFTHGNHEGYRDAFFKRLALPGNERWYSFDVAGMHFVCLDTGLSDDEPALIASQSAWLESDLSDAQERGCDWITVFFHRSPYAEGGHGNMQDVIDGWVPIFDRHDVDIVFAGHNHFYQRTYPLRAGAVTDGTQSTYRHPGGTIYVTTGGSGAPIHSPEEGPRIAAGYEDFHYCVVRVQPEGKMHLEVKGLDGTLVDQFTIDKSANPPEPVPTSWYFAEGYTGAGFQEYLCLANVTSRDAKAEVTYMFNGQKPQERELQVKAGSRTTVNVNDVVGEGKEVSARISSQTPLVVERPIYFLYQGKWSGGHDVVGATSPGRRWYFAEGTTREGFEEWITVLNPSAYEATVNFGYMLEGEGAVTRTETVEPTSRKTFRVADHIGTGKDASLLLESDRSIVAERPTYFAYNGLAANNWQGGHCVVGAAAGSKRWFFAEGTTREGFEEWLCLQNPNTADTTVSVRYLLGRGQGDPVNAEYVVPARQRLTVSVNRVVGSQKDVSVELSSSDEFVAERPMYFLYHEQWGGGHDCLGVVSGGTTWLFAEGNTASDFQEWLCLVNPSGSTANVVVTYFTESGGTITRAHHIEPYSRYTISVNQDAGADMALAAAVTSDVDIVAERPMYFDYGGLAGGHCAPGYQPQ
jgi:Purple acid Phosphatase, N-terminal domain/Calcineurin-like phosphoesterase/Family of unknown function (DUF5719)